MKTRILVRMEIAWLQTPLGALKIEGDNDGLRSVSFMDDTPETRPPVPPVLKNAVIQLQEYFDNQRDRFDLRLNPEGSDFQKRVWEHLQSIPFGKTKSYQSMANELGDPKVIRAAASANGKNPIAIIIPCHRVIGSDGSLTGYAGGLHRKKWLLQHESPVTQTSLF